MAGEQMAEYRGRTALLSDAISEGRLTLQINDARTSDDGKYWCLFDYWHHFSNNICSILVSVLCFGNFHNISNFFIIIFITEACDQ